MLKSMKSDYPESYSRVCLYTCFIMISTLLCLTQITNVFSNALVLPVTKSVSSNQIVGKPKESTESVMRSIIDPKVLLASANEIHNSSNNVTIINKNLSGLTPLKDSTVLLSHQILPPKDFIIIYDSTPYTIATGYLTAKLPCDDDFHSMTSILVGKLTDLKPVPMVPVKQLSRPGFLCMYNSYLSLSKFVSIGFGNTIVTDILLFNPTSHRIVLPNTSTIIVGVNEILSPPKTDK